ncbi:MAG: PH domain-containing protein [Alteromonadaceae bacterium]|nr:PH domain-containing protein [Alteromonadaceae bacterium]
MKATDHHNRNTDSFTNTLVNIVDLPQLQQLNFENLSAKYALTRLFTHLLMTLLIIIIAFIFQHFSLLPFPKDVHHNIFIGILILSALSLLLSIYLWFSDHHKHYALREQDLSYASGLIFKKIVTQPILRIQHIELKRGPIERKVGLASLQVFSAGGALHTFEISGLTLAIAESIRQYILQHKDMTLSKKNIVESSQSESNND